MEKGNESKGGGWYRIWASPNRRPVANEATQVEMPMSQSDPTSKNYVLLVDRY